MNRNCFLIRKVEEINKPKKAFLDVVSIVLKVNKINIINENSFLNFSSLFFNKSTNVNGKKTITNQLENSWF